MKSPITRSSDVRLVKEVSTCDIIQCYKSWPRIETDIYFKDISSLQLYQCIKTDYLFYYPYIVGDNLFYQALQDLGWYYQEDRWEYFKALSFINCDESVLEVGCGQGFFLKKLQSRQNNQVVGIDLNSKGISLAKEEGLIAYEETLEQHFLRTQKQYDVVCAFQVLEHIPEVKQFLDAMLTVLKPGGKLILAVPNNDSFIKHIDLWANLPPHHVGLWNKKSISSLQRYFPIKLKSLCFEPLHCEWFYQTHLNRLIKFIDQFSQNKINFKIKQVVKSSFLKRITLLFLQLLQSHLHGHTLLAVFKEL